MDKTRNRKKNGRKKIWNRRKCAHLPCHFASIRSNCMHVARWCGSVLSGMRKICAHRTLLSHQYRCNIMTGLMTLTSNVRTKDSFHCRMGNSGRVRRRRTNKSNLMIFHNRSTTRTTKHNYEEQHSHQAPAVAAPTVWAVRLWATCFSVFFFSLNRFLRPLRHFWTFEWMNTRAIVDGVLACVLECMFVFVFVCVKKNC